MRAGRDLSLFIGVGLMQKSLALSQESQQVLDLHKSLALSQELQQVLDLHNEYRCMHGVPLFTWDDEIASNAKAWASKGKYEHSTSESRKIQGEQCGENIAWGYPNRSGTDSTRAWYNEIKFTKPSGTANGPKDSTPKGQVIGHYTQIVWKSSTKLGCAKGSAVSMGHSGDFWVCQYCIAGNFLGQYGQNVLAPTKSAADCGGTDADVPSKGADDHAASIPKYLPVPLVTLLAAVSCLA